MRRHQRTRPRRRGFTIIESMSTLVVLGTVASAASFVILAAVDSYMEAATRIQLHSEMSVAMDRIVRELRRVRLDPDESSPVPDFNHIQSNVIAWGDDAGLHGLLYTSPPKLQLQAPVLGDLLDDVTAFSFTCYDEDNTALALPLAHPACLAVRRIELNMTITRNGVTESLRAKVFIRSGVTGSA